MAMDWATFWGIERDTLRVTLPKLCYSGPVILIGPPGTGKTTDAWDAGCDATPGEEPVMCSADPGATSDHFVGGYRPLGTGQWGWLHGPFTAAVERDVWLVINDSHLMGPDGMAALYRALDYGIGGDYHLDDGRVVRRGPRHRVVMTANGTLDLLDEPVLDRCRNKVPVTIPSASMLARLVLNAGQPDECQALAVACLNDYLGGVDRVATYREWAAVADNLRSGLTLAQALGAALYTGNDDNYGGYGRCVAVLDDLVLLNVPGAAALQQQIAAQHPSGAA